MGGIRQGALRLVEADKRARHVRHQQRILAAEALA